eukprot:6469923-Prymnesium_polylepis.1
MAYFQPDDFAEHMSGVWDNHFGFVAAHTRQPVRTGGVMGGEGGGIARRAACSTSVKRKDKEGEI